MNTDFDFVEGQLRQLRPARLPGAVRQQIWSELEQPATRHSVGHGTGLWLALASALTLTLFAGWLKLSPVLSPTLRGQSALLVASNSVLPSLPAWDTSLSSTSPIWVNTVAVLHSSPLATGNQFHR